MKAAAVANLSPDEAAIHHARVARDEFKTAAEILDQWPPRLCDVDAAKLRLRAGADALRALEAQLGLIEARARDVRAQVRVAMGGVS